MPAKVEPTKVVTLLAKDVKHRLSLPVLPSLIHELHHALIQPCGMARQFALNTLGGRELQTQLTLDLSYLITKEAISVNDRVDMPKYADMIHGWCLGCTIHFIVGLHL
jgi:hypothetical protein